MCILPIVCWKRSNSLLHIFIEWINLMMLAVYSRWSQKSLLLPHFLWLFQVVPWFEKPLWSEIEWSLSSVSSHSSIVSSMPYFFIIISFVQDGHCIEHILGSLQGWYMWDPMEVEIILLTLTKSFLCFIFISLWICIFFFDIVLQVMLFQVWEALHTSMLRGYRFLQACSQAWYYFSSW